MTATSLDLSQIKTDALSSAATFRTLIGLGSSDAVTFKEATLTSGTVTSSTPVINATQTWNEGATTFTGVLANITDTASASTSLLMDLKVGGSSVFSVSKAGSISVPSTLSSVSAPIISSGNSGLYFTLAGTEIVYYRYSTAWINMTSNGLRVRNTAAIGFSAGDPAVYGSDTTLYRDAANTLAQRNGTNAQTFRLYNTYTSSTSFENLQLQWNSNEARIGTSVGSAGGTQRNLVLGGWNSAGAWNPALTITPQGVPTFSMGTVTSSQPFTVTQTWNDGATTFTGILANITDTASASASLLMDLQVGGSSKFNVDKSGAITTVAGSNASVFVSKNTKVYDTINYSILAVANSTGGLRLGSTYSIINTSAYFGWGITDIGSPSNPDVRIYRDAANTLAQRNGTNAQTFNIYNTYTSSTSYELGFMRWNSNVLEIGTEAGSGGGSVRNAKFAGGNSYILCQNGNDIQFFRNGFNFLTIANGLVRLFNSSLWNVKDIQLQYGYTEMLDSTPPSTPSADRCRIYAKDNGSGKTQLVVLMPDGIETVLATET